jgi:hypothetical protein
MGRLRLDSKYDTGIIYNSPVRKLIDESGPSTSQSPFNTLTSYESSTLKFTYLSKTPD